MTIDSHGRFHFIRKNQRRVVKRLRKMSLTLTNTRNCTLSNMADKIYAHFHLDVFFARKQRNDQHQKMYIQHVKYLLIEKCTSGIFYRIQLIY